MFAFCFNQYEKFFKQGLGKKKTKNKKPCPLELTFDLKGRQTAMEICIYIGWLQVLWRKVKDGKGVRLQ